MRHIQALVLLWLGSGLLAACNPHSEAEDAVRRIARDPDSVRFRDVIVCDKGQALTRGDFNAKNGFGAYNGFEPFFYAADTGVVTAGDPQFSGLLERCYGHDIVAQANAMTSGALVETPPATPAEAATEEAPPPSPAPEPIKAADLSDTCFGDYCPCDRSDPDFGGMDVTLCRNLEQGIPVEKDILAAGAAGRDARRSLREFNEETGGF